MPTLHKLMARVFGVALVLAAAPVLCAGYYSGNEMLGFCKSTNLVEERACFGYLAGVVDAEHERMWPARGVQEFCIPVGITLRQLRHVFLRWMEQHPEQWHDAGAGLVFTAFREAWPCAD